MPWGGGAHGEAPGLVRRQASIVVSMTTSQGHFPPPQTFRVWSCPHVGSGCSHLGCFVAKGPCERNNKMSELSFLLLDTVTQRRGELSP